jgi:hypothetical protein
MNHTFFLELKKVLKSCTINSKKYLIYSINFSNLPQIYKSVGIFFFEVF